MRKTAFCICENKDADQLRGNREADQRLCFRCIDSTIPLLPIKYKNSSFKSSENIQKKECGPNTEYIRNFKSLAIFCGCTARFVSDLVKNPEDRFSHNDAHVTLSWIGNDQDLTQL